ncbi:hypothetical protein [Methylorubrum sp. SB2]|uniref:hypothetical protein n=1 Tax=Methylorubrum subtropicum TaxID=3138812 RepID=UPI00313AF781
MANQDVVRAQGWTTELIRWEAEGWGDAGNAMGRVARSAGIPFRKLWALKYRPPKTIASHILSALEAAHAAEKQRQLRKLAADADCTESLAAGSRRHSVEQARAVLRQAVDAASTVAEEGRP